jgi:hypothetical protein
VSLQHAQKEKRSKKMALAQDSKMKNVYKIQKMLIGKSLLMVSDCHQADKLSEEKKLQLNQPRSMMKNLIRKLQRIFRNILPIIFL